MKCWCGYEGRDFHYPGLDPENGPAHRPSPPCPKCCNAPHAGPCEELEGDESMEVIYWREEPCFAESGPDGTISIMSGFVLERLANGDVRVCRHDNDRETIIKAAWIEPTPANDEEVNG